MTSTFCQAHGDKLQGSTIIRSPLSARPASPRLVNSNPSVKEAHWGNSDAAANIWIPIHPSTICNHAQGQNHLGTTTEGISAVTEGRSAGNTTPRSRPRHSIELRRRTRRGDIVALLRYMSSRDGQIIVCQPANAERHSQFRIMSSPPLGACLVPVHVAGTRWRGAHERAAATGTVKRARTHSIGEGTGGTRRRGNVRERTE